MSFFNHFKSPLLFTVIVSLIVGGLSGITASILAPALIPQFAPLSDSIIKKIIVNPDSETGKFAPAVDLDDNGATIDVVKKASPAVVSIVVMKEVNKNQASVQQFPFDDFFKDFGLPFEFKIEPAPQPNSNEKKSTEKQQVGGGSGFIIKSDGLILTNKHVVSDAAAEYIVVMNNGKQYPAKILAIDPLLDAALLKIEATDLPTLSLGDSDKMQIGQTVIAIGNALGQFSNSVTKGVISGINRRVVAGNGWGESEVIEEAIQTDAAINPGNSGGPLLNLAGAVIGINTAVSQQGQLVGFAIPINQVKKMVTSVEKFGRVVRPWLGVRYVIVNKEIAAKEKLPVDYGALLVKGDKVGETAVVAGSPADKAGLAENDVILEADGMKIDEEHSLSSVIGKHQVGEKVKLKILHQGQNKEIEVELEEMKK